MNTPTTRRFARTLNEAFPHGMNYAASIHCAHRGSGIGSYLLAIAIGLCFAVLLFRNL